MVHVLIGCPNLRELRQEFRNKIGDAFSDIKIMLGGRPRDTQTGKQGWVNAEVLNAVLGFAEASQRF